MKGVSELSTPRDRTKQSNLPQGKSIQGPERRTVPGEEQPAGDTRDGTRAFSNGGVAALAALGMLACPHPAWLGAFLGAPATANGGTGTTELGTLSRRAHCCQNPLGIPDRGNGG